MAETNIYIMVRVLSAKYSVCIYMISVAVIIYSGRVMGSSQTLLSAPRAKASDGLLIDLARKLRLRESLREINNSVSCLE